MYRNAQHRSFNGGSDYYVEPSTPPDGYRVSTQKKNGEGSPGDFSPGLLDLHSFDTELLTEVSILFQRSSCRIIFGLYNRCLSPWFVYTMQNLN